MLLNFILALLPILWLFVAFLALKMPGHIGCLIALVIAIAEALIFKNSSLGGDIIGGLNATEAATATLEGVVTAIWPIGLIIIAAMFCYYLCVRTKAMELIKKMLTSVTNDKRVLVLILAWGFGGFMEAVAGFGTAVAIPAAMMVALGFKPLFSAVACLVANAAPPTFGSVGIPTVTAAKLIGLEGENVLIAAPAIDMLAIPAFLSPFIIIWLIGQSENAKNAFEGMLGFTLVTALSYVIPAVIVGHTLGAELVDVIGCTVSLITMVLYAKFQKPTENPDFIMSMSADEEKELKEIKFGYLQAWMPYILMLVLLICTSKLVPAINGALADFKSSIQIFSSDTIASKPVSLSYFNTALWIFLAGVIGGFAQGAGVGTIFGVLGETIKKMWKAIATIVFIVSMATVMKYSGMTTSIATLLADMTGGIYPAFAPIVGIIGTFVTGSTTSSGILFAQMQMDVAAQLVSKGISVNEYQLVAGNMAGGAIGKLVSPQSIAIAVAAIGLSGADGQIMRNTTKFCIAFGIIVCAFSYITAVVLSDKTANKATLVPQIPQKQILVLNQTEPQIPENIVIR